ncbi:MAG: tyrosine-type recombinase/integrase [Acidobacteria bacterium]|nr:tyrosine-type recombinase/integrase [Acidobacteriota bacterium]
MLIQITNTKTEEERTVGITSRLRIELGRLWEESPKDMDSLVFGITDTIKTAFASACQNANIKDFHLHDCRHTATTRMIASGSPFLRYLNITPETAVGCAVRLDDYLKERLLVECHKLKL